MRAFNPWPFADAVIQAQQDQGLSARAAAVVAGVPATTYHRAVTGGGQPSLSTAGRLLLFAGVDAGEAGRLQGFRVLTNEVKNGRSS